MNDITTLLVIHANIACQGVLFAKVFESRTADKIFNKI